MKLKLREFRAPAIVAGVFVLVLGCAAQSSYSLDSFPDPPKATGTDAMSASVVNSDGLEKAVFAGGCFWGVQGVFERLKGVTDTWAGYSGGSADTAHYEIVSTGTTGHAESVEVMFDPKQISYGTLLKVFFSVVCDPTQLNYQGPDHGTQYRNALFYTNQAQKEVAEKYIALLGKANVFPNKIVTQVVPFKAFYKAEDYHQHFLDKNPRYPYIVYWDMPKIADLRRMYPQLVKEQYK
ncbi:peptide-methionine (S)-S-oxide reductase MsrA [Salinispira pacifica]